MSKLLWMAVTPDKYELPICVAETAELLGRYMGISKQAIIIRANRGGGITKDNKILKIEIEEDDYETRNN